jgi:rhamnulose-1-phosphate aldolase
MIHMPVEPPYPDLEELMVAIGEAGLRMSEIEASEGAAGNISVCLGWQIDPRRKFPLSETILLPEAVPELAFRSFLVTGSGRRLRDIIRDPAANLGFVTVNEDGRTGVLYTNHRRLFTNLTSEFNSHLAVHKDQVMRSGTNFHAIIHAQPPYLTFLSSVPRYQDETYLNSHLLRWQPELIVNLPRGLGFIPFKVPGSRELMEANVISLRAHRVAVWAKHGVMARSDMSVKRASDRIEYAESAAHYEYLNLASGEHGEGLTAEEIRAICQAFNVKQDIF